MNDKWNAIAFWLTQDRRTSPPRPNEERKVAQIISGYSYPELLRTCLGNVAAFGSLTHTQMARAMDTDGQTATAVATAAVGLRLLATMEGRERTTYVLTPLARRHQGLFAAPGRARQMRGVTPNEGTPNRWGGGRVQPPRDPGTELGE